MELETYRRRILAMRARLRGDLDQMTPVASPGTLGGRLHGWSSMTAPTAETATEAFDRDLAFGLLSGKDRTLRQLENALESIEDGTYGTCDRCFRTIPKARLEAIPYATRCVRCAAAPETR